MITDWSKYKNFRKEEFDCKHTGYNNMLPAFMDTLQAIRDDFGSPMVITSGFRDVSHPVEQRKLERGESAGEHTFGCAADINIYGVDAIELVSLAYRHGIRRIGVNQMGGYNERFIHLGMGDRDLGFYPSLWTY